MIYTRQSVCAPIRAEDGITGTLCPPNSAKSFAEGPEDIQIGGYPTKVQLEASRVDATTLDSEGRCVILEFPAFVLFGVYSPATRDETRDNFRLGFLDVLDARIRNLASLGKRVVLTGDFNVSREELDTANAEAAMRKNGFTVEEYMSTPARRMFNQLLEGGKVIGERDQGRASAVLWDICRGFHPERKGMFTCWEQKVNARPGNYGSRIDYVLSSLDMKTWFSDSNIQEGLMVRSAHRCSRLFKLTPPGIRSLSCICNHQGSGSHRRWRYPYFRCYQSSWDVLERPTKAGILHKGYASNVWEVDPGIRWTSEYQRHVRAETSAGLSKRHSSASTHPNQLWGARRV